MTRIWTLGLLTLALGLACTGGAETTDVGVDAAVPVPDPVPDANPGKAKRPGRDRDPGRRRPDGGPSGDDDDGDRKSCPTPGLEASTSVAGNPVRNLVDDDPKTSWCEAASGSAVGSELTWNRGDGCSFDRIELLAGNYENKETLQEYSRLKRVRVYDAEKPEQQKEFEFEDATGRPFDTALNQPEILELPASLSGAKTLKLRIDAVYGGSRADTACVSSMKLVQGP